MRLAYLETCRTPDTALGSAPSLTRLPHSPGSSKESNNPTIWW